MAITRAREVEVADVWADDEGGVTVRVKSRFVSLTVSLTVAEAAEFAKQIAVAIGDVLDGDRDAGLTVAELRARLATPVGSEGVF